jgi:hypothetical protein
MNYDNIKQKCNFKHKILFSGQSWYVQSDISETDKSGFYRVYVTVFRGDELPENKEEAIWDFHPDCPKPRQRIPAFGSQT